MPHRAHWARLVVATQALVFERLKRNDLHHLVTPASRRRRERFRSSQEAWGYFMRKPLFRRFDPDCLRDYVVRWVGCRRWGKGLAVVDHGVEGPGALVGCTHTCRAVLVVGLWQAASGLSGQ